MKARHAALTLSFLLAVPLVSAVEVLGVDFVSISEAMGLAWGAIGALFNFEYIPSDEGIRLGIMKFFVFILILRVVQVALRGKEGKGWIDNKTAGIIGFVVAGTTVLFTPNAWLFSSVIALLVPVGFIGYVCWFAMMRLKEDWVQHLFGLVLLFVAFFTNVFALELFQTTFETVYSQPFVLLLLNFTLAVILILIIVKLLQLIAGENGAFGGGEGGGGLWDRMRGKGGNGRKGKYGPDDGSDRYSKGTSENNPDGGKDGKGDDETVSKKPKGLDWENPGRVRIFVTNADDNPEVGVGVRVYPVAPGVWKSIKNLANIELAFRDMTGPNGTTPSRTQYATIPSGRVRIVVHRKRWPELKAFIGAWLGAKWLGGITGLFLGALFGASTAVVGGAVAAIVAGLYARGEVATKEEIIQPFSETGEIQTIEIKIGKRDTSAEGFEPHIDRVEYRDNLLYTEAHIDSRRNSQELERD